MDKKIKKMAQVLKINNTEFYYHELPSLKTISKICPNNLNKFLSYMIFHSQIYVLKYKFKNVNKNKTDKPKLNGSGVQPNN